MIIYAFIILFASINHESTMGKNNIPEHIFFSSSSGCIFAPPESGPHSKSRLPERVNLILREGLAWNLSAFNAPN